MRRSSQPWQREGACKGPEGAAAVAWPNNRRTDEWEHGEQGGEREEEVRGGIKGLISYDKEFGF